MLLCVSYFWRIVCEILELLLPLIIGRTYWHNYFDLVFLYHYRNIQVFHFFLGKLKFSRNFSFHLSFKYIGIKFVHNIHMFHFYSVYTYAHFLLLMMFFTFIFLLTNLASFICQVLFLFKKTLLLSLLIPSTVSSLSFLLIFPHHYQFFYSVILSLDLLFFQFLKFSA